MRRALMVLLGLLLCIGHAAAAAPVLGEDRWITPARCDGETETETRIERRIATPVCGPARNDEPESETAKTPHSSAAPTPDTEDPISAGVAGATGDKISPSTGRLCPQGEGCEGCDQVEGQWWTEEDVRMLAALLDHESIDLPGDEGVLPLWCVLNRMESPAFPSTIYGVLTQPGQFMASYGPPRESTVQRVREELLRYEAWRSGESDDRPLPEGLYFYCGCGRYNLFRTEYRGGKYWAQGNWQ